VFACITVHVFKLTSLTLIVTYSKTNQLLRVTVLSNHNVSTGCLTRDLVYADPDAEVVALSPKSLMESDRYVCEICNQGFQRDQNLQMHRRRHKVR